MGLMNRMSVTIVLTAALLLSAHAWVLQITNDEVEVGKTKNISLKCVNVYPLTVVSEIVRIRILKFEADEWNSVAEVSDRGNDLRTKSNNVLAEANSGAIASRFLRITWPVATNGTLGQYRCDVISLTAQENVMWHKSLPILITRKIVTVQTLSYKMEEYKQQCLKQTQDVLANATETIEVVEAELESKLESQIEVLSHTMENITEELDQLRSETEGTVETLEAGLESKLESQKQVLSHTMETITEGLDQLRSETEGTVETLEAGWESKLESQKQNLSQAVEENRRFCVNQTHDLVEKLTASYELKLDDLKASHDLKLDDLKASSKLRLDALNSSYELKLDALGASYELKLDALKRLLLPQTCADVQGWGPRPVARLSNGMEVVCDTETDGGGWLVIQRRASAAVDFFRGWDDYKNGFGDLDGNFWFGLEKVHQLTNQGQYELRFDFEYEGTNYYATYSSFSLDGEPDNYKIWMSGFSGNLRDRINYHNGQPFTTKDRDNDERSGDNCAVERHGAWWYYSWSTVNLNGEWASTRYAKGLFWADVTGYGESVSFSEMKIRERAGK